MHPQTSHQDTREQETLIDGSARPNASGLQSIMDTRVLELDLDALETTPPRSSHPLVGAPRRSRPSRRWLMAVVVLSLVALFLWGDRVIPRFLESRVDTLRSTLEISEEEAHTRRALRGLGWVAASESDASKGLFRQVTFRKGDAAVHVTIWETPSREMLRSLRQKSHHITRGGQVFEFERVRGMTRKDLSALIQAVQVLHGHVGESLPTPKLSIASRV